MKETRLICDRCQQVIPTRDERLADFLAQEYLGKDICPSCDSIIQIAKACEEQDLIKNQPRGSALKAWLKMYGIDAE